MKIEHVHRHHSGHEQQGLVAQLGFDTVPQGHMAQWRSLGKGVALPRLAKQSWGDA